MADTAGSVTVPEQPYRDIVVDAASALLDAYDSFGGFQFSDLEYALGDQMEPLRQAVRSSKASQAASDG